MTLYTYFLSWTYRDTAGYQGYGNGDITVESPITSGQHIKQIQEALCPAVAKDIGSGDPNFKLVILNYQLMKKTREKKKAG